MRKTLLLSAVVLAVAAFDAQAQTMKVNMADVPMHIMAVAKAVAGNLQITEAQIEIENGKPVYEFKTKLPSGKVREIDVLFDGTIEEIEDEIAMDDVPKPVQDALKKWLPGFSPSKAEKSTRLGGRIMYEFDGKLGGVEVDVDVSPDGMHVMVSDDSAG